MFQSRQKARVDGIYYKDLKELETIKEKLTDKYLRLEAIKAVSSNAKFYLGKSIPTYFVDKQCPVVPL